MDLITNLKGEVGLVLVGGNICSGKDAAANYAAAYIRKTQGMNAGPVSMSACLSQAYGFTESTPREKLTEVLGANPETPWTAELVANNLQVEPGSIVVINGIRKVADAKYFFEQFSYSHFIALFAGDNTLVQRIIRRNRPIDFPPGTPEEQKPVIARQMLSEEEKAFGINAMLSYVCTVPCKAEKKLNQGAGSRGYIIDTTGQKDNSGLELAVQKALKNFGIM